MKHITATLVALMIAVSPCQSQTAPAGTRQIAWADHLRNSTVSFGQVVTKNGKTTFEVIGSGLIIARQVASGQQIAFATALHVFDDPTTEWHPAQLRVRLASEQDKPLDDDFGYVLPLVDSHRKKLFHSPGDGSDVAVIPIPHDLAFRVMLGAGFTDAIGLQDFATGDEVYDGQTIAVFGFPGDVSVLMGPNALVRAVTRSGIVAWTDPLVKDAAFMIDANILPGNSGGPVFEVPTGSDRFGNISLGRGSKFLGIVTSTVRNEYVQGIGGLGRVEPASKVKELFDGLFRAF